MYVNNKGHMLYNDIIEIVKTWNGIGQFLFFFVTAFSGLMLGMLVIGIIGEFFTETLPVLLRGYPPCKKEEAEDND